MNQKLSRIVGLIEESVPINLGDFDRYIPFGGQSEFDVVDLINASASKAWSSVDIETGELAHEMTYEVGLGMHWGKVLFHIGQSVPFVVLLDPEIPLGLICQVSGAQIFDGTDGWEKDFKYSADWRKHTSQDPDWCAYINEWLAFCEGLGRSNVCH